MRPTAGGILASLQPSMRDTQQVQLAQKLLDTDPSAAAQVTVAHLETLVSAAALLRSPKEFRDYMSAYVRRLAKEQSLDRLRELLAEFLGPAHL